MITQAIKHWFLKLFGWWPRNKSQDVSYAPVDKRANATLTSEGPGHSAIPNMTPQPGMAPLIAGTTQSEITCSTIDEPPDHTRSPSLPAGENRGTPPATTASNAPAGQAQGEGRLKPTPEQQLDFLQYLVRRGLVNEGFPEDHIPRQYRHD